MKRKHFSILILSVTIIAITCLCVINVPRLLFYTVLGVPIEWNINVNKIFFSVSEKEIADIYIEVIADSFDRDRNKETLPSFHNLYIVSDSLISQEVKDRIDMYFFGYSIHIHWIKDRSEAPREACCAGAVIDGAIITPGEIIFPGQNKAYVEVEIFVSGSAAGRDIYYLQKIDDEWKIIRSYPIWQTISLPAHQGKIESAKFIVLEEPSGRARAGLQDLLDMVVLIDLPLEIALSCQRSWHTMGLTLPARNRLNPRRWAM